MASAAASVAQRGGLSQVLEAFGRPAWASPEPKGLPCPRPRPVQPRSVWPDTPDPEPEVRASLTNPSSNAAAAVGVSAVRPDASVEAGLAELRRLFAAECSLGTSAPGFGVSPPVRSGAANGLVHDSLWHQEAQRASKACLRTLQERVGPRSLAASSCAGDYRLLMTSPDQSLQLLAGSLEPDDDGEGSAAAVEAVLPLPLAGAAPIGGSAGSRASPVLPAWRRTAYCPSPDPADLFSY